MRGRHHPWLGLTIFCVVLANGLTAQAQSWLSDRKRAEGHGIMVGDNLELHPGVGAEVGYNSNVFLADKNLADTPTLRISPHLFMSTLGGERTEDDQYANPPWVAFNGGLSGTFDHFFDYSKHDALGTNILADLIFAPQRPVGLHIDERFTRSALPFSDTTLPASVLRNQKGADYTHYDDAAGAQLLFQSRGGLLKAAIGYRFGVAWFNDPGFQFNNNLSHGATLMTSWEFLPKTALFYEGSYTFQDYFKNNNATLMQAAYTSLFNSHQVSSKLGINGAITSRIGATIAAGYGAGFFKNDSDYDDFIGNAEVRYRPSDESEIGLGVDRTFGSSYQGNFQGRNRIYARFRWMFGGAFLLSANGGIEFIKFGPEPKQDNRERSDRRYVAELSGEYRFVSWLAATAQFTMLIDDTNFIFQPPPNSASGAAPDPAKYTQFQGWLGLRAFY